MSAHLVFWCFEIPIFVQLNGKISGNIHPFLMCFITSFFISWSFPLHFILFNVEESNFFFKIFMKFTSTFLMPFTALIVLQTYSFCMRTAKYCHNGLTTNCNICKAFWHRPRGRSRGRGRCRLYAYFVTVRGPR